jgi:hypothetical protein
MSYHLRCYDGELVAFKYLLFIIVYTLYCRVSTHCFYVLYVTKERRSSVQAMQLSNGLTDPYRSVIGTSHVRCHMVHFAFIDQYFFGVSLKGIHPDKWVYRSGWFWCFMASMAPFFRIAFI